MKYLDNGYIDIDYIMSKNLVFNYLLTGRGTGKTFGALSWAVEQGQVLLFMRRTQSQLDMVTSDAFNPFKPINRFRDGREYRFIKAGKNVIELRDHVYDEETGKMIPDGPCVGYAAALSTVQNLKGLAADDVDLIIFDECVPMPSEREVKFEDAVFRKAYETVARNRELEGRAPLRTLLMGNAGSNIACDLLLQSGVAAKIARMAVKRREEDIDPQLSRGIWYLTNTPITEAKKGTALYRASSDDYLMSELDNQIGETGRQIVSRDLRGYKPFVAIGGLCIYLKKGSDERVYVSSHKSGSPVEYPYTREGLLHFRNHAIWLRAMVWRERVEYENVLCELLMRKIIGLDK